MKLFSLRKRTARHARPAHRAELLSMADIRTASAWGLTSEQWQGLTDFERAECRRNVTAAPRFGADQ